MLNTLLNVIAMVCITGPLIKKKKHYIKRCHMMSFAAVYNYADELISGFYVVFLRYTWCDTLFNILQVSMVTTNTCNIIGLNGGFMRLLWVFEVRINTQASTFLLF